MAMNTSFFGEMLSSITERGRALLDLARDRRAAPAVRSESFVGIVRGTAHRAAAKPPAWRLPARSLPNTPN